MLSLLRTKSETKKFFKTYFPNSEGFIRFVNKRLMDFPLYDTLPSESPGHVYGWVGTAFDYRARYYLKVTPYKDLMAYQGGECFKTNAKFERNINRWIRTARKGKARLHIKTERKVCLLCLLLAKLDILGRSSFYGPPSDILGAFHYKIVSKAIKQPTIDSTLNILEKSYDSAVLGDLIGLSQLFQKELIAWKWRYSYLNPTFDGSRDVGGADGDLMLDSALVEIKCKKRNISSNDLFQLIGYKLLDYSDRYGIDYLFFYFGRHAKFYGWKFKKLIAVLDCPLKSISELRRRFREAVDEDRVNSYDFF